MWKIQIWQLRRNIKRRLKLIITKKHYLTRTNIKFRCYEITVRTNTCFHTSLKFQSITGSCWIFTKFELATLVELPSNKAPLVCLTFCEQLFAVGGFSQSRAIEKSKGTPQWFICIILLPEGNSFCKQPLLKFKLACIYDTRCKSKTCCRF